MSDTASIVVTARLRPDDLQQLRQVATANGSTVSAQVGRCVRIALPNLPVATQPRTGNT